MRGCLFRQSPILARLAGLFQAFAALNLTFASVQAAFRVLGWADTKFDVTHLASRLVEGVGPTKPGNLRANAREGANSGSGSCEMRGSPARGSAPGGARSAKGFATE